MKTTFALIWAALISAVLLFTGCEKEVDEVTEQRPECYLKLYQAYEDGKIFDEVETWAAGKSIVRFTDGHKIHVPIEDFIIHNCTDKAPAAVADRNGYWAVGGNLTDIKADKTLSDSEAWPVYVFYDTSTLYMRLSNSKILKFQSRYLIEKAERDRKQNIPVVKIITDGNAGIYDKKTYVKGEIIISDPEKLYSDVEKFTARMGIRGRGNSTWSFPKKPWKVKLDEKAEILGMPADKEWALLANYSDRTLIRNLVAMKLSEICGFSWTPRMRSVEVYLNHEYQGVYTFCEHKKVSSSRVNIDLVGENDNEGEAVTGGYYLEIEEQQDETTCWITSMDVPMMFSDPEEPTAQQLEYVQNLFQSFEDALRAKDWSEETGYPKYIDVDSFIDYYIVQELTKNIDGNLRKSTFLTKERGKKLEMYHLWDFDITLGNCGYFWHGVGNGPENFWIKLDRWYPHLFKDPAFVSKVKARWNELEPQFRQVPAFIDEQVFSLEKAQERNFEKWDINEYVDWIGFPSLGSYEKEVSYMKNFYMQRLGWLSTEINKL